jgi:hypothetical protein
VIFAKAEAPAYRHVKVARLTSRHITNIFLKGTCQQRIGRIPGTTRYQQALFYNTNCPLVKDPESFPFGSDSLVDVVSSTPVS